ncbi:hypothetical protein L1987_43337 [Smallanthus sonchifolius]|uniref:Uncharacterized protein n=1 Tax=Smallanthus sonchifolius TaxID=185202 RepID=A0ACB9GND8_9ASTR|nr:hypothetical protein L1987_43337 [Smallanthus sonchifolius]
MQAILARFMWWSSTRLSWLMNDRPSMDGLSSFKTSRINLVDLAGSERQKLTGAAGERLKEAGNIKSFTLTTWV